MLAFLGGGLFGGLVGWVYLAYREGRLGRLAASAGLRDRGSPPPGGRDRSGR